VTTSTGLAIEIKGLTKRFGPTLALNNVDLAVGRGRSCALLGRNGAGKSTLIAALMGLIQADEGEIAVRAADGADAEGAGSDAIACVYQKSTLVPDLSVAENIWLGAYPRGRFGSVDWKAMRSTAIDLLAEWGIERTVDRTVESLQPIERKIVEICRALSRKPAILLLDEPTAGLDEAGCNELFDKIKSAKGRGVTILYVSHYLDEVFEVCDEAVILRDGAVVKTALMSDLTVVKIVDAMVGEVHGKQGSRVLAPSTPVAPDAPVVLETTDLEVTGTLAPVSLTVRSGEIVGISGLDGAGHVAFAEAVVGLIRPTRGAMSVKGNRIRKASVASAIKDGIGFVPEDRHESGFSPELSVEENVTMTILNRICSRAGLIMPKKRSEVYGRLASDWEIKASSPSQAVAELSGGNQQKVVMARALASDPDVLVLINPTAGVDVAARISIYETIQDLARRGRAILVVSSDEVDFKIAHRVIVMFKGQVHDELSAGFTEKQLAAAVQGD
jgi:simple sugar transport system ATP-binding protein